VADVDREPVEPGVEVLVRPEAVEEAVGAEVDLLRGVARLVGGAEHPVGDRRHASLSERHQLLEPFLVAALRPSDCAGEPRGAVGRRGERMHTRLLLTRPRKR
jgi:hypothetical protein